MKKTSFILIVLTLALCFMMYACGSVDSGKVKGTTQGMDITTTQNITTNESTTHITDALTSALTDASSKADNLLSTTANTSVTQ